MTRRSQKTGELHGNVTDHSRAALLLVDVINDLNFPENEHLVQVAEALGRNIARLKRRCKKAGIPVIYVNDNRGRWRSDFSVVLKHCLRTTLPGHQLVRQLIPGPDDYIVLKPKHSSFYATPLDILLEYVGVKTVILTGLTTNACIMMTASEIHVRDLALFVPSDCVAALTEEENRAVLSFMEKNFDANVKPAPELDLAQILRGNK